MNGPDEKDLYDARAATYLRMTEKEKDHEIMKAITRLQNQIYRAIYSIETTASSVGPVAGKDPATKR